MGSERLRARQERPSPGTEEQGHEPASVGAFLPVLEGLAFQPLRRSADGDDPLGGTETPGEVTSAIQRRRGAGSPLPGGLRRSMEDSFGTDFSQVRIHTDAEASDLARSVQAEAFTTGHDIYFRQGAFAPGSTQGQHLLAHELTHVTQAQSGLARSTGTSVIGRANDPAEHEADRVASQVVSGLRQPAAEAAPAIARCHDHHAPVVPLQRKMWKTTDFLKKTDEGFFVRKGDAQKGLVEMMQEYSDTYEANGVVLKDKLSGALNLLLQMKQVTEWWISDHVVDVDNNLGGVATVEDPKRKKRMAGMKAFKEFLASEISTLQKQQRDAGEDATDVITEKNASYEKLEQKYNGNAKSLFENIGKLAEQLVPDEGDSSEIEIQLKLPVDPNGVGFLGGRLKGEVEREDKKVKIRAELAITGGADIDWASISGEVGGYMESQANDGATAAKLMSYALYRRFRESNAVPSEVSNFLWGGQFGDYGKGRADAWSRKVEEEVWGEGVEGNEDNYVESGALAGVTAAADAKVVKGEVGLSATTGSRIDKQSLDNRKGGAGKANKKSDSVSTALVSAATGGTRGAEKRVGRSVHSLALSSKLSVDAGISVDWETELGLGWESDGVSKTQTGQAPKTSFSTCELEMSLAVDLKLGDLLGGFGNNLVDKMSDQLIKWIRKSVTPAVSKEADDQAEAAEAIQHSQDVVSMLTGFDPQSELEKLAGAEGGSTFKVVLKLDAMKGEGSVEFRKAKETSVKIPKALEVTYGSSKRIIKFTYAGGTWATS